MTRTARRTESKPVVRLTKTPATRRYGAMRRGVAHLALFAAVAAAPPGTDEPAAPAPDVEAARQGLERLLVATSDVAPAEAVACPLIDVADVNMAFERAGVDAPLEQWWLAVAGSAGVTCTGSYVGFEDDPTFPQLDVELTVVDAGSAGGDEPAGAADEAITVTDLPWRDVRKVRLRPLRHDLRGALAPRWVRRRSARQRSGSLRSRHRVDDPRQPRPDDCRQPRRRGDGRRRPAAQRHRCRRQRRRGRPRLASPMLTRRRRV